MNRPVFSYTLHSKCDICNRMFNHAPKDLLFNTSIGMIIPPGWRHVLIEPKPELHLLVCEDHKEQVGLVIEKPKVEPAPIPAEVV